MEPRDSSPELISMVDDPRFHSWRGFVSQSVFSLLTAIDGRFTSIETNTKHEYKLMGRVSPAASSSAIDPNLSAADSEKSATSYLWGPLKRVFDGFMNQNERLIVSAQTPKVVR